MRALREAEAEDETLLERPFFVVEAREAGFSWRALQNRRRFRRISRGQYASTQLVRDARLTLEAVAHRMPASYAFSGRTAGWLHGLDMAPCDPVEVTIKRSLPARSRTGVRVRRAAIAESEVATVGGFRTTSGFRTTCDLGSGRDLVEAVVAIEMAVRARIVLIDDLADFADRNRGAKGIKRLRRALSWAEPRSESPMETRLRMQLVLARLPAPVVQADLCDSAGRFVARADLYYPDRRLAIEYDGANHRDRLEADLRRQNSLLTAGYHLLRFTAAELRAPSKVASQVRSERSRLAATLR